MHMAHVMSFFGDFSLLVHFYAWVHDQNAPSNLFT